MLASSLLLSVALAATALAGPLATNTTHPATPPAAPPTKYLMTINITSAAPVELGDTPAGQRAFQPISGGTFSGPGLQGKVLGGLDSGLVDADGHFNPDVVYLLQIAAAANDKTACNVLVRETGHAPNVFLLFETACDAYDWLNDVVAYGQAAQVAGGVAVNVFQIGVYEDE